MRVATEVVTNIIIILLALADIMMYFGVIRHFIHFCTKVFSLLPLLDAAQMRLTTLDLS